MTVSVLTAALPSRTAMLAEAKASVLAQTYPDVEHLIGIDDDRQGAGAVLNRLLTVASGDWVMVLDDDDLLAPNHIDVLVAASDDVDVVYSYPRVEGGTFINYHQPFDARLLAANFNCVSHTALIRAEALRGVDGWRNVKAFDLDLWRRMEQAGAEFRQVRQETWTYRIHGSNWSRGTLAEAAAL